jgi:type VI secretion system secreted protein VgrG
MSDSIFKKPGQKVYPFYSSDIGSRSFHIEFAGLKNDLVRLESFQGTESISQPFEFNLDLRVNDMGSVDPSGNLLFASVIGASATIIFNQPDKPEPVLINGIITSFGKSDPGVYSATLRPSLWKLTVSNNYCLYDDEVRTIPEMIKFILGKHNIIFDDRIQGVLPSLRKQDWFQAGETDFDFITHLMRKVGIYYFFSHYEEEGVYKHKMILGDDSSGYEPKADELPKVRCTFTKEESLEYDDLIISFSYEENLSPSNVQTLMMAPVSAWDTSSGQPVNTATSEKKEIKESRPNAKSLEFIQLISMQYGINQAEAELYRDKALSNIMSASCKYLGASTVPWFSPGKKFSATKNIDRALNKDFVITEVSHAGSVNNNYSNQFRASLPQYLAVEFSMSDTFPNTVLATVVSGKGTLVKDSILEDKACIKDVDYILLDDFDPDLKTLKGPTGNAVRKGIYVRFPWDDDKAAHWVQLSESMMSVPEENSTVIISRSNDNNELPEVVNSVRADGSYTVTPDNDTFNTSIGNNHSYHIGESQSASDGSDYSKNCGSSSRVSKGNSINLSIGNSSSETFSSGLTKPAKAKKYPLTVSTEQTKLGNMPKWSKTYDSVNLSYENSYGYSKGNSTNVQIGKNYSFQDGDSTSQQDGDSDHTQNGDTTNTQTGDSSNTQTGNSKNMQFGVNAFNLQTLAFSENLNFVGIMTNINVGLLSLNVNAAVNINISGPVQVNVNSGVSVNVGILHVQKEDIDIKAKDIKATMQGLKARIAGLVSNM